MNRKIGSPEGIRSSSPPRQWRAFLLDKGSNWENAMDLDFSKLDGLIPAVIQDHASGRVLMVGYMNREAFEKTVETGFATFYSRSRNKMWIKGETSGHKIAVKEIQTDCDQDCLVILAEALGPGVCHEGYASCFFRTYRDNSIIVLWHISMVKLKHWISGFADLV